MFASVLGLSADDAEWLRAQILDAALTTPVSSEEASEYGEHYVVDVPITTASGSAFVRTAWIVRRDETFPRLASCYVR